MPGSEVIVRGASPSDLDVIAALNQAIARELQDLELDAARLRRGIAAVLGSREKGFFLVAEADGEVVGALMVGYEWSPWREATFWWVNNVFVEPQWRRKGVYTAMHRHLESESRRTLGVCGIRLYTGLENQVARRTYRTLGMKGSPSEVFQIDYVM